MKISKNVILFIVLLVPSLIVQVYADNSVMNAITNNDSYQLGETVIISGSVPKTADNIPVTIIVRNPLGNVYVAGQVDLLNNLFVDNFGLNDNSMGGQYTINIKYGSQAATLHFTVNTSVLLTIPVSDNQIKVRSNGTNPIKYGDVSILPSDKKITIPIDTSQFTTSFADQQFQIPKKIIDTPGGAIILTVDGNQILCEQSETSTTRILDCSIPSGSKEIELSGTTVIPEFGPSIGLAISLSLIIAVILTRISKINF